MDGRKKLTGIIASNVNIVGQLGSLIVSVENNDENEKLIPILCEAEMIKKLARAPIGTYVVIAGQMQTRKYIDKDLEEQEITEFKADEILLV